MVSQIQNIESLESRLRLIVQADANLMNMLQSVRECALASWCIGAGAIRALVWDELHGQTIHRPSLDVDVCFFDPDATAADELHLQRSLSARLPAVCWDVVNQAHTHHWNGSPANHSLSHGLASWPETATAVGVWLDGADRIQIIAPFGLEDLFALRLRRNPAFADQQAWQRRVKEKNWQQYWPRLTLVD